MSMAAGYARRAERVWTDGKVDGQGGNGDGGPDARAEDKHRDQRDAGRRPHRRDLAMDERELQTELRRYEVGNPDHSQPQAFAGQVHPAQDHSPEYRQRRRLRQSVKRDGTNRLEAWVVNSE